jgi:UDP-N-acetylmuramyl pentapeptide phosphotransferase/UDP-N-acetylglucosamine-1-phosphate transferase
MYFLIFVVLVVIELVYFRIADKFNIIDRPNERSSHSTIVLRGGGVIFVLSTLIWVGLQSIYGECLTVLSYGSFLVGLLLIAGISFVDDINPLPDSVRLVAQFIAMGLMFYNLGFLRWDMWWAVLLALIVCVGATNIINYTCLNT